MRKRFGQQAKGEKPGVGVPLEILADMGELGAIYVKAGAREFGAWSKQMIESLGEAVRPYLKAVWGRIKAKNPDLAVTMKSGWKAGEQARTAQPGAAVQEVPESLPLKDLSEDGEGGRGGVCGQPIVEPHRAGAGSMTPMKPPVPELSIQTDTTVRLKLQAGDMFIWFRFHDILSGTSSLGILDLWILHEPTAATITTRSSDLPPWFALHPTETSNALAYRMQQRLQSGYSPTDPVDGPNIWRALAGDRVVHAGKAHGGDLPRRDGLITIYAFCEDAAVFGEPGETTIEDWIAFGSPGPGEPTQDQIRIGQAALEAVKRLGLPSEISISTHWTLSR